MGMIRKQSIQTSVLSYLGVALGYINVVLLFPKFFEPEQFGLTRVLIAVITIAARFAVVGSTNSIIRFYPKLKDENGGGFGLAKQTFQVVFVGLLLVTVFLIAGKPWILEHYKERSDLFGQFYQLIFPFLIFEVTFQVFTAYLRAMYRTVISIFFREVFLRMSTTALIGLFYFDLIDFDMFMMLFVAQYGVLALSLLVALGKQVKLNSQDSSSALQKPLRIEMLKYGVFTFLSGMGTVLAVNIDVVMVGSMVGLGEVAFYTVAIYVVALIRIPYTALSNVATPIVADAWKHEDMTKIQDIYSKTSINQLLAGVLLFVGIWANEHNIFSILPDGFQAGKWVLFFVGLARLAELSLGVGSGIITLSKSYLVDVYANAIFLVVAVISNYFLIQIYGITGAAIATALSLGVLNLSRFIFLKAKFKFDPYTWKSLVTVLLGCGSYLISTFIPIQENLIVDICLRSAAIVVLFVPLALILKLSEDVNALVSLALGRLTNKGEQ